MSATTTRRAVLGLTFLALAGCGAPSALETGDALIVDASPREAPSWRRDVGRAVEHAPWELAGDWIVAPTEGALRRLDGRTGEEVWKRKLPAAAASAPVLCRDLVAVATDFPAGEVLGLDPASGRPLWTWKRAVGILAGQDTLLVFSGRGGRILRFDPATGEVLWEARRPGSGWRAPVLDLVRQTVLVPVRPDTVLALGLDGAVRWARVAGTWPRPAVGDSVLAIATDDSLLLLWDPATGEERARSRLGALVAGAPVLRGPYLYLALRNGELSALGAGDLAPRWVRRLEAPLLSAPVVAGPLLYQSGTRGRTFVFDLESGAPVDTLAHPEALLASPGVGGSGVVVVGDEGTVALYRSSR